MICQLRGSNGMLLSEGNEINQRVKKSLAVDLHLPITIISLSEIL